MLARGCLTGGHGRGEVSPSILSPKEIYMKVTLLALMVSAAALSMSAARAADMRNVTVINGTGYGIKFLGFNNPGDSDWSENELPPNSVLPDGNSVYVK